MENTDYNNKLFLVIQNDGNGDQCGASYKERLRIAETYSPNMRRLRYRTMIERVVRWHIRNGYGVSSNTEKLICLNTLEEYYQRHLQEGASSAKVKG